VPNRLQFETSPYLRQHADNPVDWYPFGKEAFALAQAEDRPILLSIGYSACHWCHVMAHESFEDPATAALMNQLFVNIKVDREEHPEVDQIYQQALQVFGEHGGWPLTMFLTPQGEPFFGGTYFPNREAFGRPSFQRVLSAIAQAYRDRREQVFEQGQKIVGIIGQIQRERGTSSGADASEGEPRLPRDYTARAAERLRNRIDPRFGGFGGAPKFPNPTALSLILRSHARTGEDLDAEPVLLTLTRMAEGGIYDQVGGGFARYSTDAEWLVPHFEKMLYDNGLLLKLYAEGLQIARARGAAPRQALFTRVIEETVAWLEREMRDPDGGFYAALDADSEGVEGKYYVFTLQEITAICGSEIAAVISRCLDVREGGNWHDPHGHGPEGASILHVIGTPRDEAEANLLAEGRARLLAARQKRVPPGTDDKVLTGWNGLCISGLTAAGRVLGRPAYLEAARRTADFLLGKVRTPDGALLRTYKAGTARLPATLDDHAFLAEALIALADATADLRYLAHAQAFMDALLAQMYEPETVTFYLAAPLSDDAGVPMVVRPVSLADSAIPSGLSVACLNLLRLAALLRPDVGARYQDIAEAALRRHAEDALRSPFGFSNLCAAVDLWSHGLTIVVIVSPAGAGTEGAAALRRAADEVYVPDLFVFSVTEGIAPPDAPPALSPHWEGKSSLHGMATAYVCQGNRCSAPVTTPSDLAALLRAEARF
jgi:hypothetical protein